MKRTHAFLLAGLLSAFAAPALAAAHSGTSAGASRVAKVELERTGVGKVLVNSAGFTLYRFSKDARNSDRCARVSGCLKTWPALVTSGKPIAGTGVKASWLSTITLPGGARQVTYDGHPLYLYAGASEHAETDYVGAQQFGGFWDAVNAAGSAVK